MSSQAGTLSKFKFIPAGLPGWASRIKPLEIVASLATAILVLAVVLFFFRSLNPERQRMERAQAELDRFRSQMTAAGTPGSVSGPSGPEQAKESLESFKSSWMKPYLEERVSVINELNELAKKNALRFTGGLKMELDKKSQGKGSKKKDETASLNAFPGMNMDVAATGPYNNLRQFLSEIEHSRHFYVVDGVAFATGEDEKGKGGPNVTSGALHMSLRLSVYFRP